MKKLTSFLSIIAIAILAVSCVDTARNSLAKEIEIANKQCPIDLGAIGRMVNMAYDKETNTLEWKYELNEEFNNIDDLSKASDVQKEYVLTYLSNEQNIHLLAKIVAAECSLKLTYVGNISQKESCILIPADELKKSATEPKLEKKDGELKQIALFANSVNAQCPQDLGDGLILTAVDIADSYVVYHYDFEIEQSAFDAIDLNVLKEEIKSELVVTFEGIAGEKIIKLFSENDFGFKYEYKITETGKLYEITFESDELKTFFD